MAKKQWNDAREKIDREGACRNCGLSWESVMSLQAAHTVNQKLQDRTKVVPLDEPDRSERIPKNFVRVIWVNPDSVIPLCVTQDGGCHGKYDAHQLDILGLLTYEEEADAVRAVGIVRAVKRLSGGKMKVVEIDEP